ncbi:MULTISPECIES: protease modulator HflK [unclassified Sphingomonas]|uniref:protease modulator HflK n=1 Tax=unclassified Sphingomonas TaxID=196159 RepID=UPI0016156735|nr:MULTISPECIES: protease modulator HflK [unclassified Sphingomonas]MBB3346882.1 membrane protease subunit HflK [Sphingomonas sp. BK069]MBB3475666.1 membrane protease subunit HflK [Sphingomonas sp. BK345]
MIISRRWLRRPIPLAAQSNGPWGNDDNVGPRNPWSVPPGAKRSGAKPTALDEFIRRARGGGGGGGGEGGGGPQLPLGANARMLWLLGVAVLVAIWLVLTSIHQIGPQQRGVVTYFGRYSGMLEPGIRVTLPAPIVNVTKVDVEQVRTDEFPRDGGETVLTGDQNIIDLAYTVRWRVSDARNYVFEIKDPQETVRATAESAMRSVLATTTLNQAIGAGRTEIEARVAETMQQILTSYQAGVQVQGVSIKQAAPPSQLADDFNAVTAAQQEAVGNLNNARSYSQQVIARAQGEASAFDQVYAQYRLAPEVTRRRMYYETMEAVLAKTDKTIVETPGVTPYLPLDRGRRLQEPNATASGTAPAQPASGGAR